MAQKKRRSPLKGRKHKKYGPVKAHKRRVKGVSGGETLAQLKSKLKKKLDDRLNKAVVRKFRATRKTDKKKAQRTISATQSEIRRLSL